MDKKQTDHYELTIKTNDIASENYVIDGQFNRVGKSFGDNSSFMLPKGLYSVKVKVGDDFFEKPIILTENKSIEFDPIVFNTPAPLSGTFDTSEFQISTASNYSKKDKSDVELGKGSKLFLFGSISSHTLSSNLPELNTDLAAGLTLRTFNDKVLVDFGNPEIGMFSWKGEPWAACDIDLKPGNYVLCLETSNGNNYKQAIVTSLGWQTQIFLQSRNYGVGKKEIRADLINGSILMSRMELGFNPKALDNFKDGTSYRLTEQIRQALIGKRKVINDELQKTLFSGKFDNPMFGIYAAHLLLQSNSASIFQEGKIIIENLRRLLGDSHPDVEAIALKIGIHTNYIFQEFPMLAASWAFVLEASAQHPDLIPQNTEAYDLAGKFWSKEFWLIWGNDSQNEFYRLKQDISGLLQQEIIGLLQLETKPNIPKEIFKVLFNVAKGIASNKNVKDKILDHLPFYEKALDNLISNINSDKIVQLGQSLGIPPQKVIDLIKEVNLDEVTLEVKKIITRTFLDRGSPQEELLKGNPKNNFRKMTASVAKSEIPGLFKVTINVVSTKKDLPIEGEVKFYLNESFLNPTPVIIAKNGIASLTLNSVLHPFPVGAELDNGKTKLELDLSKVENAPLEFRSR